MSGRTRAEGQRKKKESNQKRSAHLQTSLSLVRRRKEGELLLEVKQIRKVFSWDRELMPHKREKKPGHRGPLRGAEGKST